MIFTQAAPAATWALMVAASSSGPTGECMRGKYRFSGARKRPAAVTTGRRAAAARAKPRVTWPRPPASRITVTPPAAYSSRRAGTVLAVGQVGAVVVGGDGRVRVRVDQPGKRVPAGQFLRLARPGDAHGRPRAPSRNVPENVHAMGAQYKPELPVNALARAESAS